MPKGLQLCTQGNLWGSSPHLARGQRCGRGSQVSSLLSPRPRSFPANAVRHSSTLEVAGSNPAVPPGRVAQSGRAQVPVSPILVAGTLLEGSSAGRATGFGPVCRRFEPFPSSHNNTRRMQGGLQLEPVCPDPRRRNLMNE